MKPLSGGKGGAAGTARQADEPKPMQLAQAPMARAVGGPMMIGPGGMNAPKPGGEQDLAQQGFMMQPSLAAIKPARARPPVPPVMPGQATGMRALPGTTLNSPSQMQMALMTGSMSPYDMYANNAAYGGGFGSIVTMAQDMSQLTDMMMVNPWMFDPSQQSNQFSNYNNAALPWPPSYNTGAGGPVNAATGQPIQSFQQWQTQNPGGMSINATPAQPAQQAQPNSGQWAMNNAMLNSMGQAASRGGPSQQMNDVINMRAQNNAMYGVGLGPGGSVPQPGSVAAPQATPQAGQGAAPNNWQASINALANPGNPMTMGANVPMISGGQPAGGVNNAFLQQAGAGQGMNQGFLSALRAIQGRPQQ